MVALISVTKSFSQISNVLGLDNNVIRTKKYEDIKGSAYLYTDWSQGALTDKSGKTVSDLLVKYDAYKDQIEVSQDGQIVEIKALNYPQFYLEHTDASSGAKKRHVFSSNYQIPGFDKASYFEQLFAGKTQFLKKYKTVFTENNVSGYGTSGTQKSFQSSVLYFVVYKNESHEVKLNKKSFLQVFADQSAKVESYINSNGLKMKSEEDWISAVTFIDAQ